MPPEAFQRYYKSQLQTTEKDHRAALSPTLAVVSQNATDEAKYSSMFQYVGIF